MILIPLGEPLFADVAIENEDIGFIQGGQSAINWVPVAPQLLLQAVAHHRAKPIAGSPSYWPQPKPMNQ
jgi:hypothetical protein